MIDLKDNKPVRLLDIAHADSNSVLISKIALAAFCQQEIRGRDLSANLAHLPHCWFRFSKRSRPPARLFMDSPDGYFWLIIAQSANNLLHIPGNSMVFSLVRTLLGSEPEQPIGLIQLRIGQNGSAGDTHHFPLIFRILTRYISLLDQIS